VLLLLFLSRYRYGPQIEAAAGVALVVAGIALGPVWVIVGGALLVGAVVSAVRRSRGRDQYSRRNGGHDSRVGVAVERSA
jgi:hypothetical protein